MLIRCLVMIVSVSLLAQNVFADPDDIVIVGRRLPPTVDPRNSQQMTAPIVTNPVDIESISNSAPKLQDPSTYPSNVSTSVPSMGFGQQCAADTDKALNDCNFEGNSSVQNVMGLAGQLKNTFDQMAAANPQLACSKLGQLSGAASLASGAFNGVCSMSYQKCRSSCDEDLAAAKTAGVDTADIKANSKSCNELSTTLQKATGSIAQFANVSQAMAFCQSQTGDSWAQHCLDQPSDPFCANANNITANCSDATFAASSTICICQKNPSDPRCGSSNLASKTGNGASSSTDGSLNPGDFGSLDSSGLGGVSDPGEGVPYKAAEGDLNRGGSGKPGLGGNGGGSPGAAGKGNAAAGGSGLNTKIIGGYGGGKGGSAFGGGGSGSPGNPAYGRQVAMNTGNGNGVDLRQFLPGGQRDPSRGLAGASGPDGITGPNTDIWKKINSRYFSVSPSLLP